MPRMLKVEGESLKQLECDLYELRNFHSVRGGVHTCILNMLKPMPTATHSWGSQLRGCLCKCRASGFSSFRLKEHGLYGVLLPLESTVIMNAEEITMLRHLHPQEVALLCGLTPEHVPDHHAIHCRLTLSGVGQLASPLQSAWVLSNFLQNIYPEQIGFVVGTPKSTLASVVKDLFEARDRVWGIQKPTPYMEIFSQAIQRVLKEDDEDDMMGVLTQDILTTVKHAEAAIREEQFRKSPESQSQSFETGGFEEMPDGELQDHLSSVLLHQQDCETTEGYPVEDDGYGEGEWVCPYTDCVICSPTSTVRKPDFGDIGDNVEASEKWEVSPTIPFVVEAPPSNHMTPVGSWIMTATAKPHCLCRLKKQRHIRCKRVK